MIKTFYFKGVKNYLIGLYTQNKLIWDFNLLLNYTNGRLKSYKWKLSYQVSISVYIYYLVIELFVVFFCLK